MRYATHFLGALVVLFSSAVSSAHIVLDQPTLRETAMKTRPCGGTAPHSTDPAKITTFEPGETVTIAWHETVVHPGYFRIALSTDGTTFPADPPDPPPAAAFPVLAIIPKIAGQTAYTAEVTLPNMECESCTLQLIQYMQQHSPPPYYYQCADIVISGEVTGEPDPGTPDPGTPDPGTDSPNSVDDNGCAFSAHAPRAGAWLVVLGFAALAFRARRRSARPLAP